MTITLVVASIEIINNNNWKHAAAGVSLKCLNDFFAGWQMLQ